MDVIVFLYFIYLFFMQECIPQYTVGHSDRLGECEVYSV